MSAFEPLHRVVVLALLFAVVGAVPRPAAAAASAWVGDAHAAVRLVTASDTVSGSSIEAGLEFRFAPGWHGYWRTPGDAGLPPAFDWSASKTLAQAVVTWPAPSRLVVEGLQNSIYEGQFVLPVTLVVRDAAPASIRVLVGFAACSKVCVPFQADLDLDVPRGAGNPSAEAPAIAIARRAVPVPPAEAGIEVGEITINGAGSTRSLTVALRSGRRPFHRPDLFIEGTGSGLPPAPRVVLQQDGHVARLTADLPNAFAPGPALTFTVVDGDRSVEFVRTLKPPPSENGGFSWLAALVTALAGGLILNVMPCVLPVLSIKLLGLTRHAGAQSRAIRLGFVATALGIVACFLVLAIILVALKASGAALGWGIQFQQPWFLAGMAAVTVLFAASFFEWLPIGLPSTIMTALGGRGRAPVLEAFLTGVFATLLATPCSAPFVGTAVGFALAQGPVEIIGIFLCLGIGMSLPYAAAALLPDIARWLPRPGRWMLAVRTGLGILLLGTAVWLLHVLSETVGKGGAAVAGGALAALLALLAWRSRRSMTSGPWPRIGAVVLSIAPLAVALFAGRAVLTPDMAEGWQRFDPLALQRFVAQGRTVLVDVSATWCLTCQVNEAVALRTAQVDARLAQTNTIRMRADWTRPNPEIADYLHRFQRYGIPLDVVYGPSRPGGEPLPELLSAHVVLDALDRASMPGTR